jgi:FkbM family methyltransferase
MKSENYKSQYGQDKILNDLFFKNKKNGIFVDVGSHDGINLSNTYFYEKELGWDGLCIEPIDSVFEKLKLNRNCKLIQGCAFKNRGKVKFRKIDGYSEMLSGIVESYSIGHNNRVEHEIKEYNQKSEYIMVESYNLNDLLLEFGFTNVDFLSLDVEGSEFEIIKTIDFNKININIMSIENNEDTSTIREYLEKNGFIFHSKIAIDDIFVNKNYILN